MRLFVALNPPPGVLGEIEHAVAPYQAAWPDLRWVGRERWHVTLGFLGDVDESTVTPLVRRLADAAGRHPARDVAFAGAGAFPGRKRARVLWVGLRGDREALGQLADSVLAAARQCGVDVSERLRFHPHLTLARCRRQPVDVRPLIDELAGFDGSTWNAGEIHLMRSHLGPKPRYEILHTWPLASG